MCKIMKCSNIKYLNPVYTASLAIATDLKRCNLQQIIERVMLSVITAFLLMKTSVAPVMLAKFTYLESIAVLAGGNFFIGAIPLGLMWLFLNRHSLSNADRDYQKYYTTGNDLRVQSDKI